MRQASMILLSNKSGCFCASLTEGNRKGAAFSCCKCIRDDDEDNDAGGDIKDDTADRGTETEEKREEEEAAARCS